MNKSDMHVHTTWSDGSLSPAQVVALAAALGITELAITDHDTMAGCPEAVDAGSLLGVCVIPGVEISAWDTARSRKVHLLGYGVQDTAALEQACRPFLASRHEAQLQALHRVAEAGYPITEADVLPYTGPAGTLYRQHIMHALVDRGYATAIYGPLYTRLFAQDGLAFVPSEYMDAFDALRLIRESGGAAVLAHPFQYDSLELLPQLVERGLSGLEVRHSRHTPQQVETLRALAKTHRLVPYAGTDFHGFYNERENPLGVGSYLTFGKPIA